MWNLQGKGPPRRCSEERSEMSCHGPQRNLNDLQPQCRSTEIAPRQTLRKEQCFWEGRVTSPSPVTCKLLAREIGDP